MHKSNQNNANNCKPNLTIKTQPIQVQINTKTHHTTRQTQQNTHHKFKQTIITNPNTNVNQTNITVQHNSQNPQPTNEDKNPKIKNNNQL